MDDGRVFKLNILVPAVCRAVKTRKYLYQLICAVLLALTSVFLIRILGTELSGLSENVWETFRAGKSYNIGILSVESFDLTENSSDRILTGIMSGSFLHIIIAIVVSSYICKEYSGGYLRIALIKGVKRERVFLGYLAASMSIVIPIVVLYIAGVLFSLQVNGILHINDAGMVMGRLLVQLVMVLAVSAGIAVLSLMIGNRSAELIGTGLVVVLPLIPKYIYIASGGNMEIEKWNLMSCLVFSAGNGSNSMGWDMLISFITVVCVGVLGVVLFKVKKI